MYVMNNTKYFVFIFNLCLLERFVLRKRNNKLYGKYHLHFPYYSSKNYFKKVKAMGRQYIDKNTLTIVLTLLTHVYLSSRHHF